jgi:signal transduction histidine kinase
MSRRILVVENDKDISRLLELHLRDAGYEVSPARDGTSGSELALSKPYDMIILDIMLSGLGGLELCRREYLSIALKRSDRLRKLVAVLFELAKLDSPDLQVRSEPFSLGELVQDVTQKFKLTAEEKRMQLLSGPMGNLPLVVADIGLIERVFENLIQNALRHTPENGTITVSAMYEGGKITVLVSDTGSGIRPEDLPHVFERFYGTSRTRRDTTASGGLGLAITKKILELHGSDITVESTINVGTTFIFTLPVHQARQSPLERANCIR